MLTPCGHKLIIKPDAVETTYEGEHLSGFEIVNPEDVGAKRLQETQTKGTVIAIGRDAWKAFRSIDNDGVVRNGEPWCQIGDRIYYNKFSGHELEDPEDPDNKYYLINDEDVNVVIRGEK